MFNKQELDILNNILTYLKVHNNIYYSNELQKIIDKIMVYRAKDNARKLKYITEKRKEDKNYGKGKKESDK